MAKKTKPIWAKNIIKRRKAMGYESAEEFSAAIKVPYPTYRDIEGGASEGRYETREAIAKGLKCTIANLYEGADGPSLADFSDAADFLSRFASAPQHIQKVALMIVYRDSSFLRNFPEKVAKEATALLKTLVGF
jgi:transcriptional regulator with XRE-family HTH domain